MLLPLASCPSLMTLTSDLNPLASLHESHRGARVHAQSIADLHLAFGARHRQR